MPQHRGCAKAAFEPEQEVLGQRDFGQQDQHLSAHPDRFGNRFEIAFGLARSGHPVEQERGERLCLHRADEGIGCGLLVRRKVGHVMISACTGVRAIKIDHHRLEHACTDQPAQHPFGHAGEFGQFADAGLFAVQRVDRRQPLRGEPLGFVPGQAVFGGRAAAAQCGHAAQRQPRHRVHRRDVVIGGPLDQAAQRCAEWGDRQHFEDRPQLRSGNLFPSQPFLFPDDPKDLARSEGGDHEAAEFSRHAIGKAIVEDAQNRIEDKEADAVHRPASMATNRGARQPLFEEQGSHAN